MARKSGKQTGASRRKAKAGIASATASDPVAGEARMAGGEAQDPTDQISAAVHAAIKTVINQEVALGKSVAPYFPDRPAIEQLLAAIQDRLEADDPPIKVRLTAAPSAEKAGLLKGSFLDVVDWILRKVRALGGAGA